MKKWVRLVLCLVISVGCLCGCEAQRDYEYEQLIYQTDRTSITFVESTVNKSHNFIDFKFEAKSYEPVEIKAAYYAYKKAPDKKISIEPRCSADEQPNDMNTYSMYFDIWLGRNIKNYDMLVDYLEFALYIDSNYICSYKITDLDKKQVAIKVYKEDSLNEETSEM